MALNYGTNFIDVIKRGNVDYKVKDSTAATAIEALQETVAGLGDTYLTKADATANYQPKGEYLTSDALTGYAKTSEVNTAKSEAIAAAKAEVDKLAGTDWTEAAGTVQDILNEITSGEGKNLNTLVDKLKDLGSQSVKEFVEGKNYITNAALTGYATESYVNGKVTDMATQTWVSGEIAKINNNEIKIEGTTLSIVSV